MKTAGMRWLNESELRNLPAGVRTPGYDRDAVTPGIVHFGPGAFHRAHVAWFIEKLLEQEPRWGISAVSLRNPEVRDALAPQQNLYCLTLRGETLTHQIIGAIREVLVAPESVSAVLARLAAPATRIVTMTVTEKGYCLNADGSLNLTHPTIARDLANPRSPATAIGFLVEGLRLRREAGTRAFVSLSCDNLPDNGLRLARATTEFARHIDVDLARWIEDEALFPRTTVDSITPATTDQLRRETFDALGVHDRWPVQREAFASWVIEARDLSSCPDWDSAGVTLTDDINACERAKLRIVNGAHSTLAYMGLLLGHRTVLEAMSDPTLAAFVRSMIEADVLPTLGTPRGMNLDCYVRDVMARFRNPNMRHELAQIAWDGSQKLPIRILGVVEDALHAGRSVDRLCVPLAAWMRFVARAARRGESLNDPLAARLLQIGSACSGSGAADVPLFLAVTSIFSPSLAAEPRFTRPLTEIYDGRNTQELTVPDPLRDALRNAITGNDR